MIPAAQILLGKEGVGFEELVKVYLDFLEEALVSSAKEKIQKQLLSDALLDNTDRHLNNFGVIRNVSILQIMDVALNYDCGRILGTAFPYTPKRYTKEEFHIDELGYDVTQKQFFSLIDKNIHLSRRQYQKLYSLPERYLSLVNKYLSCTSLREGDGAYLAVVFMQNIQEIEAVLEENGCFQDTSFQ